jgi:uncharacterized repeat protein (TIGR01451 family)
MPSYAITLNPNETEKLYLCVRAPKNALANTSATIEIVGTDPRGLSASDTCVTVVKQVYKVSIDVTPAEQVVAPGETAIYTVNVTNEGNGQDIITLKINDVPSGWDTHLSATSVILEHKTSTTVKLEIIPPVDDVSSSVMVTVTGTSINGVASASDTCTIIVKVPDLEDSEIAPTTGERLQLVFVVDLSGSMWYKEFGYDETIERFMTDLVDALEAAGIEVEYALVTYGSYYSYHKPKVELTFTGDVNIVKSEIQKLSQKVGGWCEYMYWASLTGLEQDWDSSDNTIKIMTVITDEDADDEHYSYYGSPGVTSDDVISTANEENVTIYGIDCSEEWWSGSWTATQDLNTLADGTGGEVFTEQTMYQLIDLILSWFL